MIASEKGHYDIVMTLFGAGARVDHTDKVARTNINMLHCYSSAVNQFIICICYRCV